MVMARLLGGKLKTCGNTVVDLIQILSIRIPAAPRQQLGAGFDVLSWCFLLLRFWFLVSFTVTTLPIDLLRDGSH